MFDVGKNAIGKMHLHDMSEVITKTTASINVFLILIYKDMVHMGSF